MSREPTSAVICLATVFLFSEECCRTTFDFIEILDSRDVFPVDSPGLGTDDLPLLEPPALVDGEASGRISTIPRSSEIRLGRLLNCVRWTIVGSNFPIKKASEILRAIPG